MKRWYPGDDAGQVRDSVCARVHLGKLESQGGMRKGLLWAALSVATSVIVIRLCGGGWIAELLAQFGLFVGIAVVRTVRDTRNGATHR
jgi:hypothetical protein